MVLPPLLFEPRQIIRIEPDHRLSAARRAAVTIPMLNNRQRAKFRGHTGKQVRKCFIERYQYHNASAAVVPAARGTPQSRCRPTVRPTAIARARRIVEVSQKSPI